MQHQRAGLASGFICRARAVKHPLELRVFQCLIEPHAALARGHRQPMTTAAQVAQQRQDAVKQANIVLMLEEMMAIAIAKLGIFLGRHIGCGTGQCRHQRHANHIGCLLIAGHGATHIAHSLLNAARDDGGGICHRSIPVKSDQIEAARTLLAIVFAMIFSSHESLVSSQNLPARAAARHAAPRALRWQDD